MALHCSDYAVRNDFSTYISRLLSDGAVNRPLVEECRKEICVAIWGDGNPDVSGIGMIVGYALDHALGAVLVAFVLCCSVSQHSRGLEVGQRLLERFFDCAAFLCFSVQTAALVVLIKEEAGISTVNMGDGSVRITEAVSLLTLLPLLYAAALRSAPIEAVRSIASDSSVAEKDRMVASEPAKRHLKRFGILVLCWLMALYPFFCKMNNDFAPSKISDDPGSAITNEQFDTIQDVCLRNVDPISPSQSRFMSALAILSYIPMSTVILGKVIFMTLEKHHDQTRVYRKLAGWAEESHRRKWSWVLPGLLAFIPLLACGLIWTVMRVQRFQSQLVQDLDLVDDDSQWTFGQIVAVTAFAPVLLDCCLAAKHLPIFRFLLGNK